jgi:hypothetical protein
VIGRLGVSWSKVLIRITAIWDNRSTFHAANMDFAGMGERTGNRVVGIGERPYLDPNSKTRRQDLDDSE